ncbi:signal recognition particle-docking protein FtsY [Oligella urethralis]|uniref:Signal recognition particle receptor FtsY n=1 Tax=Oligella urethralis TaxID=90245 RepID=A0A2X1UJJ0_9BURK|nr:signal recognition particle-docking protein FtsY [Oligella urethralis]SPY07332.1 Cell division protein FtsY homolog [Oligella urethralis]
MFRFFKRKKAKEENQASQEAEVAQAHEQEEPAASEAIVSDKPVTTSTATVPAESVEESAVAIERAETVAPTATPVAEASATPAPLEPQPEVIVTEVEAEAEASSPAPVADAEVAPSPVVTEVAPAKSSWMQRLRQGLSRTGSSIGSLFVGVKVDEALFEELEMALLMADAGIEATESLLAKLRTKVKQQRIEDAAEVKEALKALLSEHLKPLEKDFMLPLDGTSVVMIAGVNGAGKTTSIGKLAHHFQAAGASVLLAAGDTFRAAAREQLVEWGKRNQVAVIAQDGGDPAAVAFDAVNAGKARKANVVMVDTAGRLPTQLHLMEELKKIKRVINKADSEAPHEVLLVVDGNTGQNVITQIKAFDAALGLTGLVVTKLDGTAKGGTLAAVAAGSQGVRPIPVYWIGVGESLHDLQPFSAAEFANALLG